MTCVINSIARKAGREGERARTARRMAACVVEAEGAEPVSTLLDSNTELFFGNGNIFYNSKAMRRGLQSRPCLMNTNL